MSLSIAFFGSSLVSAYWNGAATYYRGILQALAGTATASRSTSPTPTIDSSIATSTIRIGPGWWCIRATEDGSRAALEGARDADMVVKASGVGVFDELFEAAVSAATRRGAIVAFWDVDAPATLDRVAAIPAIRFAR